MLDMAWIAEAVPEVNWSWASSPGAVVAAVGKEATAEGRSQNVSTKWIKQRTRKARIIAFVVSTRDSLPAYAGLLVRMYACIEGRNLRKHAPSVQWVDIWTEGREVAGRQARNKQRKCQRNNERLGAENVLFKEQSNGIISLPFRLFVFFPLNSFV